MFRVYDLLGDNTILRTRFKLLAATVTRLGSGRAYDWDHRSDAERVHEEDEIDQMLQEMENAGIDPTNWRESEAYLDRRYGRHAARGADSGQRRAAWN